ncbi:LEA type 2 family protein [Marinihelvus fidelis]|uniref:LEA type 2 family protein n=1 Tax=Marinihelvus fidelis TaxID=2613842 RepID=A0A5N0T886_9GAMM|nr:LEA type 2 family protein [Marinihelvus fidelis]KAA9130928.1 LEA type 2 family protein [Marinihelvus fidelis]
MNHQTADVPPSPRAWRLPALCTALLLLLTACGGGGVKGEAPFVQVTSWRIDGNALAVSLRLRNVNSEALVVDSIHLDIEVDDTPLATHIAQQRFEIAANGMESLELQLTAKDDGVAALERLSSGETGSLRTRIEGDVISPDEGRLAFHRDGHIYTVPGRPGNFR